MTYRAMLVSILQHMLMHKVTLDTTVAVLWLQEYRSYFPIWFRSLSRGNRFIPSSRFAKQLMTETNDNSPNSLNCSAVSDGVPDVHGSVVSKDDSSRGKELLSAVGLMRGFSWKRRAGECHLADLFFPRLDGLYLTGTGFQLREQAARGNSVDTGLFKNLTDE